jgi:uncharacterized membrane protein
MSLKPGIRKVLMVLGTIGLMLVTAGVASLRQRTEDFEWKAALLALQMVLSLVVVGVALTFIVTIWTDQARSAETAFRKAMRTVAPGSSDRDKS